MDEHNLKKLYEEHSGAVYNYLLKIFRSEDQAEETLQEVFFRFFRLAQRKKIENIRSYLFRIAHNLYVDFIANRIRQERLISTLQPAVDEKEFTHDIHWDNLRDSMISELQKRKDDYAKAFMLRIDHDMTYPEIAYVLGVSERTVIRHFEDIRTILKTNFKKELGL